MTVYKKSTAKSVKKYQEKLIGRVSNINGRLTKISLNSDGTISWDLEEGKQVYRNNAEGDDTKFYYLGDGSKTEEYWSGGRNVGRTTYYYKKYEYAENGVDITPGDFIEYILESSEVYPKNGYTTDENGQPNFYYEEISPLYVVKCDDKYYKIDNGKLALINDEFEEKEEYFKIYGSTSCVINSFDQFKGNYTQNTEIIKWLPIEDPYNNTIYLKSYKNYDELNKRYIGGRIIIPLEEIDENAKKCHVQLQGKNFYIKTSLYNDQHYTYAMPYTTLGDQYIMDIDMTTAPLTTTHIPTKDNPFCLLIDISSDGYLEAYSYSWY